MSVPTTACIIGAGPGGIAMGYHLKKKLKCNDFIIVDQNSGAGGTWFSNTYPGCDLNGVVDKFSLQGHLKLSTKVTAATWLEEASCWEVEFKSLRSGHVFKRKFTAVISATGIFSRPKFPEIEGMDSFTGASWHTGRWNWDFDLSGKKVAVIGNGCSGCQVIPAIAPRTGQLTHLARSKQWLFERPNVPFSPVAKWLFRVLPGWMRWTRWSIYYAVDELYLEYIKNPRSESLRSRSEEEARDYMTKRTPTKYLEDVMPTYPVGCKRRVLDPGYLDALHRDNVDLCSDKISKIDETGVQLANGKHIDADAIVYATGFYTQEYLAPISILGQDGKSLSEHWKDTDGCQAYLGTTVSGFPNFAVMFGPNASPAHNSVIYTLEVQAAYIAQTFFEPILTGRAKAVVVKRSAEDYDCNLVQQKLTDSVWHAGCTNWTLNEHGRNCTSFPGYIRSFWWKLLWPRWEDYLLLGGKTGWQVKYASLKARQHKIPLAMLVLGVFGSYNGSSVLDTWRSISTSIQAAM